jgi:aminoglycoside phosphotransferase (APT) family kinase protein
VQGSPDAGRSVSLLGQALRVLHDSSAVEQSGVLAQLPAHSFAAEAVSVLRAGELIRALLPSVGRAYDALVAAVVDRLERQTGAPMTFLHGDLKADNLLVDGDRVRILDLDRSCVGDPALDLGKFLADLAWWRGGPALGAEADALAAAFRDGYGPGAGDRWARAGVLAALYQLKFAARRCAVHDEQWAARVTAQVTAASATLSTGTEA